MKNMLKRVKLGEIAEIFNGIPDVKQSVPLQQSEAIIYKLIQPNNLGLFNNIEHPSQIGRLKPLHDNYLVRVNDILIKRLNPESATLVKKTLTNTTFSSNLLLIRVFTAFNPAYIACVLENQSMTRLNSNIIGSITAVRSISIKALASMPIPLVDYKKQQAIGKMWLLSQKRRKLLGELVEEDQRLVAAVLNRITAITKEEA